MKHKDILRVYEAGPEAVIKLINSFMATITELKERIKTLEDQQSKNSRNSSKPPSTDGFVRVKSQRRRSDPQADRKDIPNIP